MDKSKITLSLDWLLEPQNPGVRYLALRDLVRLQPDDQQLIEAKKNAYEQGHIATILDHMHEEGYWVEPGPGYRPKYRSTVWALILLAQLGASLEEDERIDIACQYLLEHTYAQGGYFTHSGTPSGTFDCLQGNLCWALSKLGCQDPRLTEAYHWMARSVTGEGIAQKSEKKAPIRYYAYQCGPGFECGSNYALPCAWGATKIMLAFSQLPSNKRSALVKRAIEIGMDFFFSVEPTSATWPFHERINSAWWKFGFPVFYITDLLQVAEALAFLGYAKDPRLASLIQLIFDKADEKGRWDLEYHYNKKTWGTYGEKGKPNKWVTLRASRVLHTWF